MSFRIYLIFFLFFSPILIKSTNQQSNKNTSTNNNINSNNYKNNNNNDFNLSYLEKIYKSKTEITSSLMEKISYSISKIPPLPSYYISFNGGKDCLAGYILLKYYFYCLEKGIPYTKKSSLLSFSYSSSLNSDYYTPPGKIFFLYFMRGSSFKEEIEYVKKFAKNERIDLFITELPYIKGIKFFINYFQFDTVIMGTRKNDLKYETQEEIKKISEELVAESSGNYPKFLRFFPVFNFDYNEIWKVILITNFEYLNLYDKGYSSIGYTNDTSINKNLISNGNKNFTEKFIPAWALDNDFNEREFRK